MRSKFVVHVLTLLLFFVGVLSGTDNSRDDKSALHRIEPGTPHGLQTLLAAGEEPLPLVGAHRGGPRKGFPENCLATFEETLRHTFASMEIDPMEVMIPNVAKAEQFDRLGIPWRNVIAFVGHNPPDDPPLYAFIHRKGASCMIGTSRNLDLKVLRDEVADIKALEPEYRAFLRRGADVIETDIPAPLGILLYRATPVPAARREFFRIPAQP